MRDLDTLLERLEIIPMASGNASLLLTERVDWDLFPSYAESILQFLNGAAVSRVDGPDQRVWTVRIDSQLFWFSYEDYPAGVSLESQNEAASALIPDIRQRLLDQRASRPMTDGQDSSSWRRRPD